jgi:hypothetical protein
MNTNRFEARKTQTINRQDPTSAGPAWWGLAIGATFAIALAVWFLTHAAA